METITQERRPVTLTLRQREVLQVMAEGAEMKEAASELRISLSAIKWHLSRIRARTGSRNTAHAIYILCRASP